MKIQNLHIIPKDKFDKDFIKFINKNFNESQHFFLITSNSKNYKDEYKDIKNVYIYSNRIFKNSILKRLFLPFDIINNFIVFYYYSSRAKKIFWHHLEKRRYLFLYIFRNFLKKSYWIIWGTGGDEERKDFFYNFIKKIEFFVLGNFKGYITHVKGDYEIIKKQTNCNGKYYDCFVYPSNLYKEISLKKYKKRSLYIQVGNSAQNCNNHLEIFEKLKLYKNKNIKIFCILSYGDEGNKENIIKKGKEIFKEKFFPIVDFMDFHKYMEFLSRVDIAIFAHDVQKAAGNITSLLSMKKTVYLKKSVTTYEMLKKLGIEVKDFDEFENLEKFNEDILEKNNKIIKERFSEKRLIEDLKNIFEN